jgi:hypothetical protein
LTPHLVAELARLLREPPGTAEIALDQVLGRLPSPPPLADLVELGASARRARASDEELALAIGTLLALHAPPAGPLGSPA